MAPDTTTSGSPAYPEPVSAVNGTKNWTVMVFMGADTIQGTEPLDEAAEADLAEMESMFSVETDQPEENLAAGAGALDVFVQVHRSARATRRYHYRFDPQEGKPTKSEKVIPEGEREKALVDFIKGSIGESSHRRGDYSMLVLWGHAYDFAFGRSTTREGVVDAIDFVELSTLLEQLQREMKEWLRQRYGDSSDELSMLDIIAFDACDVATVEMACQLQPFAKYLLGSEIGIPIPGWPYDRILDRLRRPFGRVMGPSEFGAYVVRRFCESYPPSAPVSLTCLDLTQADVLREDVEFLARLLNVAIEDPDTRDLMAELFVRSQTAEERPYVDVVDLCLNLVRESGDPRVSAAARAVGDRLLSSRSVVGKSETGDGRPLIVEHGRNACELARLNGISLYAPHVASNDFGAVRSLYNKFVFAKDTDWSELVHTLATQS